jgi:predicted HTH domain antitoxin
MESLKVQLELPRDLLGALDVPEAELEPQLRQLIALELFRQNRISSGKAAELLSIPKTAFIQLLARHNIPYFTETPEELDAQVTAVKRKLDASTS